MDVISSLETAEKVVDTVARISMYHWTKRNLITLAIATVTIATVTVAIHIIKDKQKGDDCFVNQTD